MLLCYLLIGAVVSAAMIALDGLTYPAYTLSPVFLLAQIAIWPFTLVAILSAVFEADE